MYKVRKLFKFEAAHVLESSYSLDYQNIHGHSYEVEVILKSKKLNKDGMVCDFGELKDIISSIFMDFDHSVIVPESLSEHIVNTAFVKHAIIVKFNPTAENMAKHFYDLIEDEMLVYGVENVKIHKVIVHETKTVWASYQENK
jgi:6-pyruvoyltetrahydropterin/6-carboxytetrahydropterin synthase